MNLHAALKSVTDLFALDGEGPTERFDRLAAMFHTETGEMAPGKDRPATGEVCDPDALRDRYDAWFIGKVKSAREALIWAEGGADKSETFARGLTLLSEHTGINVEGSFCYEREHPDELFRYHVAHDGSLVRGGHDDERRNCDDCDFYTIERDVMSCPHCSGSVG